MTDKKQFISNWLKDNPNDDEFDATEGFNHCLNKIKGTLR